VACDEHGAAELDFVVVEAFGMYSEDSWVLYFLFEVHVVVSVCGARFIRVYL